MRFAIVILLMVLCLSCGADLFEFAHRDLNEPQMVKPFTECLVKENTIRIYWDDDFSADEYLLYRSDTETGLYSLCYSGQNCSFLDTGLESKKYFYRLKKRRAEVLFPQISTNAVTAMGVANIIVQDDHENNNKKETATQLLNIAKANTYYYSDSIGNEVADVDWYKMLVNPGRIIELEISCPTNSDIEEVDLQYAHDNNTEFIIIGSGGDTIIDLENDSLGTEPVMKYFRIKLNPQSFKGDNGAIGSYQIKFRREINSGA